MRELRPEDVAALAGHDPDDLLRQLDKLDCEDPEIGLRNYMKLAWSIIEPGRTFVPNWHIDCIADHLMAVSRGQITRLLLGVPPGGMKSLTTDAFWPSHEWGPQGRPELRYVSASYNVDLTVRDNRRTRTLITSPWYQALWGDRFQLVGDQNAKTRFDNDRMGFKIATSVGGLGTGERGDRFICFPGSEMVLTDRGPMEIGDIVQRRLPVSVWSADTRSGECGWHPVTGWHENPGSEIVEVVLSDGASVRCTPDHRLWTRRGWVRADQLRSDDVLPPPTPSNQADVRDRDPLSEGGLQEFGRRADSRGRTPLFVRRVGWADRTFCLTVGDVGTFVAGHSSCIAHSGIVVTNCDDPHNIKEGESNAKRNEVLLWFSEVVPTRLNDPTLSAIIVIMQRVHEQDVAGLILDRELGYVHICLPMEFEPARKCFVEVTGWEDPRTEENQLLWPERMTREVVERDKKVMGSYAVAAQFQQRPAPRGGGMFKRMWWQFFETGHRTRPMDVTENPAKPMPSSFDMQLISVDAAFKSTASGSRVGIVLVGTVGPYRYVLDNRTRSMTFSETVAEILALLGQYPRCNRVLIEDKANGPAIIDTLIQRVSGIIAVNPQGGKEARANAMQASVESGHWLVPEGAPWVDDFITEFATFPASAKNDQVDATTQAAIYLTHGASITRLLGMGKR